MPELLLRDEPQTTAKSEEDLPPPNVAYIDTSAVLQSHRYADYLAQHGAYVYKFGGEWEDFPGYIVVGVGESIPENRWALVGNRGWPYYAQAIDILGTAFERSDIVLYEVKRAKPIKAMITAVLSQTAEYFGYSLQKQLKLNIEPPAFKLLENLTLATVAQKVLAMIAIEKQGGMPIRSVSITSFKDPEAANFEELVVKVCLDCDSDTALRIWDDLSTNIEDLKRDLSSHEIKVLDERLGLDCEW